ncbi:MAG: hybrid sensor histidine kinase/response regulator [Pirellulaceae bacterium]|nr:MAG: hybrid sensor histidine kinase/response regulator [Pirellulaceae bacterium]
MHAVPVPRHSNRTTHWLVRLSYVAAALLALGFQLALNLGVIGSILYLPVVWIAYRTSRPKDIYAAAAVASLMVLLDAFLNPPQLYMWRLVVNRTLGLSAIWMTAYMFVQILRSHQEIVARDQSRSRIVEHALEGVVSTTADGRILDWNKKASEIFGWSKAEVLGKRIMDVLGSSEDDSDHPIQHLYNALQQTPEGTNILECKSRRKSGEEILVEISMVPLTINNTLLVTGFVRDITDRDEIAAYRTLMAALVDSSYDAIIGKDSQGTIISWNAGAERIFQYTEEEALGKTAKLILPPGLHEEEEEIRHALANRTRLEQFETVRRRKDGTLLPVSITVSPILDDHERLLGWSFIERDMTDRKREREELQRAKEAAERAVQVRSQFLANVSHELRTPMNAIIGMTDLALEEELSEPVRDYLETARSAAHSLLRLLNDILDFSKIEAGKFSIEEAPFSVQEVVDETIKALGGRALAKQLELICEVDHHIPEELMGDASRLRQILMNLVGNAIKFTDRGEVFVKVRLARAWARGARLEFSVRDTGIGIPPDKRRLILQPFTQIHGDTHRPREGTGLGLAITSELIRLMGGKLTVDSEVERGSCFSFRLSFNRPRRKSAKSKKHFPLAPVAGQLTLVLDDSPGMRQALGEILYGWSMNHFACGTVEEALRALRQAQHGGTPFSLILCDFSFPGLDSASFLKLLASECDLAPPVIFMVTGNSATGQLEDLSYPSRIVFTPKPVTQSDLMHAMLRAFDLRLPDPEESTAHLKRGSRLLPTSAAGGLKVLLAEDTPANQKLVRTVLEKRGHRVHVAQNGEEAVESARREAFDLILMDIQMPIMDGMQATAAIRQWEESQPRSTPIVALTAHAMRGDRELCLQAGMDAYLAKPLDVGELIELVETIALDPKMEHDLQHTHVPLVVGGAKPNTGSSHIATPLPGPAAEHSMSTAPTNSRAGSNEGAGAARAADQPTDIVDMEGTMQRLGGDLELFREFVQYFLEDSPQLLRQLRTAGHSADAATIERAAHSLKGMAKNFGATRCAEIAARIEAAGQAGDSTVAVKQVEALEHEVARLATALQSLRMQLNND